MTHYLVLGTDMAKGEAIWERGTIQAPNPETAVKKLGMESFSILQVYAVAEGPQGDMAKWNRKDLDI